jgi:hypothetical protein
MDEEVVVDVYDNLRAKIRVERWKISMLRRLQKNSSDKMMICRRKKKMLNNLCLLQSLRRREEGGAEGGAGAGEQRLLRQPCRAPQSTCGRMCRTTPGPHVLSGRARSIPAQLLPSSTCPTSWGV